MMMWFVRDLNPTMLPFVPNAILALNPRLKVSSWMTLHLTERLVCLKIRMALVAYMASTT